MSEAHQNLLSSLAQHAGFDAAFEAYEPTRFSLSRFVIPPTRPTTRRVIRQQPTSMPGEFWGVVSLFNPAGYKNKLENFRVFSTRVRKQGLRLLAIECAFGNADFEVPEDLCDLLVQRRTSAVMWQKERLLNVALDSLPAACDKVAWLGADVLFQNNNWVSQTAELLESYCVVQPYRTAHWLEPNTRRPAKVSAAALGPKDGGWMPSMGYQMARTDDWKKAFQDYFAHGHVGFAWAIRREIIQRHGFYDAQILGNGDFVMAHAMYGNEDFWNGDHWQRHRLTETMLTHMEHWGRPFFADVSASVSFAPGRLLHLWHGSYDDRLYNHRLDILKRCAFDPTRDLKVDDNGCWAWATDHPELQAWSQQYFVSRNEEGSS